MDAITQNRREFHKFAETSWNEIRTSARIAEILETAGVQTILMGRDAVNVETLHSPIELSMQQRQQNMRDVSEVTFRIIAALLNYFSSQRKKRSSVHSPWWIKGF